MTDSDSPPEISDRFLITGCQRSGTTLMAMALEAHDQIEIVEENDARFHRQGALTRELDIEAAMQVAVPEGGNIGYKAPRDSHRLDEISTAFPLIRILWVEREMRQTVSSMLSLHNDRDCWAATFAPREISKYIESTKDEHTKALFDGINELRDKAARAVSLAALCWLVKREQYRLWKRRLGKQILRVDYDTLVTNPETVLREMLRFLGLPWSSLVLDHPRAIVRSVRPGGANPSRSIDSDSRNKWRLRLSNGDLDIIAGVKQSFAGTREFENAIESNADRPDLVITKPLHDET